MKKLIMLVFSVVMSLASGLNLFGAAAPAALVPASIVAPVPTEIPLTRDKQEAFALSNVNRLSGIVVGQTINAENNGSSFSVAYTPVDGDPKNIAAAFKRNAFAYSVDPSEQLRHVAIWEIRTPDGSTYQALYGEKPFKLVKDVAGTWQVPADSLRLDNLTFGDIPFVFPGIVDAQANFQDAGGNPIGGYNFSEHGRIRNGYLILGGDVDFTGRIGVFIALLGDGTRLTYGLDGRLRSKISVTSPGLDTSSPDVRALADNATDVVLKATDVVVRVKYTATPAKPVTTAPYAVAVRFEAGVVLPISTTVVEKAAFDTNPTSGRVLDLGTGKDDGFNPTSGQVWLVLINRPRGSSSGGGGGGGGSGK